MNQPPALPLRALQGAVPDRVRRGRLFRLAGLEDDSFDSAQKRRSGLIVPAAIGRKEAVHRGRRYILCVLERRALRGRDVTGVRQLGP